MENTEKIRIFAQYLGNTFAIRGKSKILTPKELKRIITNPLTLEDGVYKLVLNPLDMLTEEDAQVLINMANKKLGTPVTESAAEYIDTIKAILNEGEEYLALDYSEVEYLREKGYAIPHKGESLFDLELAINWAQLTEV